MIPYSSLGPLEVIFTHVLPSGENITVASDRLREAALADTSLEIVRVPIEAEAARRFISMNAVNQKRCADLLRGKPKALFEPVLWGKEGGFTDGLPDVFFIDGHHRYVCHVALGLPAILSIILERPYWERFRISGLPPITNEQLSAIPTTRLGEPR